jgi:hypothetical protein
MMRLIDYVQVAFYVLLGLLAVLVAAQAIATMRDISTDLRQGQVIHQGMIREHDAIMQRLGH